MPSPRELIPDLLERADAVVDGTVTALGPPPAADAGDMAALQELTIDVELSHAGPLQVGTSARFASSVIPGAARVAIGPDGPGLDPDRFATGARVRIYAARKADQWRVLEDAEALVALGDR